MQRDDGEGTQRLLAFNRKMSVSFEDFGEKTSCCFIVAGTYVPDMGALPVTLAVLLAWIELTSIMLKIGIFWLRSPLCKN